MAVGTFYVRPKGTVGASNGSGSSSANAINGIAALNTLLSSGAISGASTIKFDASQGPFGLADAADFPNTLLQTQGLPSGQLAGCFIGTNQSSTSLASGKTFLFQNDTGWALFDMRGGTTNAQRMYAALHLRGEDMLVDHPKVWAPNQNYLAMGIPGSGANAETLSYENIALVVRGNGNIVQDGQIWGSDGFCRFGLLMVVSNPGVGNASPNKTNIVRRCDFSGCLTGCSIETGGAGGFDACSGQAVDFSFNYSHDPVWGRRPGDRASPGNAARHGNAMTMTGKFFAKAICHDNEATGGWQDCFEIGITSGVICKNNYGHDLGVLTADCWIYSGSGTTWNLNLDFPVTGGNGIKCGLGGYDNIGPTTWLGDDGTPGGNFNLAEARNIIVGNKIVNCVGEGITTNGCKGAFIHANELLDVKSSGILLENDNGSGVKVAGTMYVSHNLVRVASLAPNFVSGLRALNNLRIHLYNNIFWTDSTKSHFDVDWSSNITVLGKNKNLLVTGRTQGSGVYPTTGDLAQQVPAWTDHVGLTVGSPLIGAGDSSHFTKARSHNATLNMFGQRLNLSAPNVGPI